MWINPGSAARITCVKTKKTLEEYKFSNLHMLGWGVGGGGGGGGLIINRFSRISIN